MNRINNTYAIYEQKRCSHFLDTQNGSKSPELGYEEMAISDDARSIPFAFDIRYIQNAIFRYFFPFSPWLMV